MSEEKKRVLVRDKEGNFYEVEKKVLDASKLDAAQIKNVIGTPPPEEPENEAYEPSRRYQPTPQVQIIINPAPPGPDGRQAPPAEQEQALRKRDPGKEGEGDVQGQWYDGWFRRHQWFRNWNDYYRVRWYDSWFFGQ